MLQIIVFTLASSPAKDLDSTALAKEIKAGNHEAFRSFYDLHCNSLMGFLLGKNTSRSAAEDLIQIAFLYIWEHRNKIDPNKSLRAYLFQIAYTRMLNHHRDTKKFNHQNTVPDQQTEITPEDHARASDLHKAIKQAIIKMPEKRGTVFQLCFLQDLTYKEAAQTLGLSVKTIENHMALALKDMRYALKEFR